MTSQPFSDINKIRQAFTQIADGSALIIGGMTVLNDFVRQQEAVLLGVAAAASTREVGAGVGEPAAVEEQPQPQAVAPANHPQAPVAPAQSHQPVAQTAPQAAQMAAQPVALAQAAQPVAPAQSHQPVAPAAQPVSVTMPQIQTALRTIAQTEGTDWILGTLFPQLGISQNIVEELPAAGYAQAWELITAHHPQAQVAL